MSTRLLACLLLAAGPCLGACSSAATTETTDAAWDPYGAAVTDAEPMALGSVLDEASAYDGATLLIEADVEEVCQSKGCWMMLTDGEREMRVKFQDYGFFVPMDIQGRTARVEGVFTIEEVPLEEARHYLEDAGKHEEAAALTEAQRSYTFTATGVLLK